MNQADFNRLAVRYIIGFGASLVLSVVAYLIVRGGWQVPHVGMMAVLLLLASIQLVIQLACFLHLGFGGRARSRTLTISFTIIMMLIIVIGSIWIMQNLDYRMRTSGSEMNQYMKAQNKKGF